MRTDQVLSLSRLTLAIVILCMVGCGPNGAARAPVHGTVRLDGQPLTNGNILFVPIDGNSGSTTGGLIQDGSYALQDDASPSPGWNRVEIRSVRKSGRRVPKPLAPPGELMDEEVEGIAEQFNVNSTLKVELVSGKDNAHVFDVTSIPK
jgi:hypothetical protein